MGREDSEPRLEAYWQWLAIGLVILATIWLRWHLLGVPLERDEGEYAYGGQLLLQGVPPYAKLYNMKLPGIYAAYALALLVFGQSLTGIHLALLVVNAASILLVFVLGRQLIGRLGGFAAGAVFALLAMGQAVQGVFANAEHFVLLPALAALVLLWRGSQTKRSGELLAAGLLFGLSFLIKQHGGLFALGGLLYLGLIWRLERQPRAHLFRHLGLVAGGAALPYAVTCLLLFKAGVFADFWFWTVDYAKAYASQLSWAAAWFNLRTQATAMALDAPLPWLAVLAGAGLCLAGRLALRQRAFLIGLTLVSMLAVSPGFFFRPHYFVLLLPAAALLAGLAFDRLGQALERRWGAGAARGLVLLGLGLCLGSSLYAQRQFLLLSTPAEASAEAYWPNPFNESLAIGRYIREHSAPNDSIAVIGSEPQIFFYADRRSATGYIYMYPLMEDHAFAPTMQQRLIAEVEQARPEYLLFVRVPTSWLQGPRSSTLIYDWFVGYKERYFHRVGLVEIFEQSSRISWQPELHWPPETPYWVEILRRNETQTEKGE